MAKSRIVSVSLVSVSLAAAALLGVAGCASAADNGSQNSSQNSGNQRIYLDPETGQVIQHPAGETPSADSRQNAGHGNSRRQEQGQKRGQKRRQEPRGYTRWTTKDGTQMLSVDPSQMPKERVVRCPDGSLRMGGPADDAKHRNTDQHHRPDRAKLCDQDIR